MPKARVRHVVLDRLITHSLAATTPNRMRPLRLFAVPEISQSSSRTGTQPGLHTAGANAVLPDPTKILCNL